MVNIQKQIQNRFDHTQTELFDTLSIIEAFSAKYQMAKQALQQNFDTNTLLAGMVLFEHLIKNDFYIALTAFLQAEGKEDPFYSFIEKNLFSLTGHFLPKDTFLDYEYDFIHGSFLHICTYKNNEFTEEKEFCYSLTEKELEKFSKKLQEILLSFYEQQDMILFLSTKTEEALLENEAIYEAFPMQADYLLLFTDIRELTSIEFQELFMNIKENTYLLEAYDGTLESFYLLSLHLLQIYFTKLCGWDTEKYQSKCKIPCRKNGCISLLLMTLDLPDWTIEYRNLSFMEYAKEVTLRAVGMQIQA